MIEGEKRYDYFGQWVREVREEMRISQAEAARRAKTAQGRRVTPQRWNYIELGYPRGANGEFSHPERETVIMVADALGVPRSRALEVAGFRPDHEPQLSGIEAYLAEMNHRGAEMVTAYARMLFSQFPEFRAADM